MVTAKGKMEGKVFKAEETTTFPAKKRKYPLQENGGRGEGVRG